MQKASEGTGNRAGPTEGRISELKDENLGMIQVEEEN